MSIFVDKNETFRITINFKEARNIDNDVTGLIILPDDSDDPDKMQCVCEARGRDFENMSSVMEACTAINHTNGKPVIQISKFCKMIILRFFATWNIYDNDESDTPLPITNENIGNLHYKMVRALARKWLLLTDGRVDIK